MCLWRLCHYPPTAAAGNFPGPEPNFCFSSVSDTSLPLPSSGTAPSEGESLHSFGKTEMRSSFWLQPLPKTACMVQGHAQVQPLEDCSQHRDLSLSLTGGPKDLTEGLENFPPLAQHTHTNTAHTPSSQLRCDCKQGGVSLQGWAAGKAAAAGCGSCWCLLLYLPQTFFLLP